MTALKKARREYGVALDGTPCVGVTTVVGEWGNKDGLVHAANQLGLKGLTLAEWKLKRDIGTLAHSMIEAHLGSTSIDDALVGTAADVAVPAATVYGQFRQWWPTVGLEVMSLETQIVDRILGFGGTIDLIARSKDGLHIVDWKTGSQLRGESAVMQMAAYVHLYDLHNPGEHVHSALVVHIPVDGPVRVHRVTKEQITRGQVAFAALLGIYRSRKLLHLPEAM